MANVVYTTLLEACRRRDEPQDMDIDEAVVWEVEDIGNSRIVKGVLEYRVRWAGSTEVEDRWHTIDHTDNCPDTLKKFPQKFHRKPRDGIEVCVKAPVRDLPKMGISQYATSS